MTRIYRFFILMLLLSAPFAAKGQSTNHSIFEHLIDTAGLRFHIEKLCSAEFAGRAAGTEGGAMAAAYIKEVLQRCGVSKRGLKYEQSFKNGNDTLTNIVGEINATSPSSEYIVLGAHYDHLGVIKEILYPGADDNASGIAALLELAETFGKIRESGGKIPVNIIFLFFDGKEASMSGSKYFIGKFRIRSENVRFMINLDQLGSNMAPPHNNKEYMLVLGGMTDFEKRRLDICNQLSDFKIDIDYTFYDSEKFYDLFYRLSDHYQFAKAGIKAFHFTSGITGRTYKSSDTPDGIDYPLLEKRTRLIFRFIYSSF